MDIGPYDCLHVCQVPLLALTVTSATGLWQPPFQKPKLTLADHFPEQKYSRHFWFQISPVQILELEAQKKSNSDISLHFSVSVNELLRLPTPCFFLSFCHTSTCMSQAYTSVCLHVGNPTLGLFVVTCCVNLCESGVIRGRMSEWKLSFAVDYCHVPSRLLSEFTSRFFLE